MQCKRHNLIYQITNLIDGKIYIGRHSTNNINDGYMGSGKNLKKVMKEFGRENFTKEILFDFDNPEEMIAKEIELLTEEFVNCDGNYNLGSGQGGLFTHDERVRKLIKDFNTGFVTAKDKDGNTLRISKEDPRYLNGELVHMFHNSVCVKDSDGNKFRVPLNDLRWLNGELIGMNSGNKRPSETIEKHVEFMKEYWSENKHSDEGLQKMKDVNKGKVTVKNINGETFRVSCDDPRYLSGEFVVAFKGTKLSKSACDKISENKKGCVWVSNLELEKTKLIRPEQVEKYLEEGWLKYRVWFNKPNWKIKLEKYINA